MSDTLPTIDADQLTKAVCLAAAGTLTSVEAEPENETVNEWHNCDTSLETVKADKTSTSLKCLETLSTSVSSNFGKLNSLNLDRSCFVYSPRNIKPNLNNIKHEISTPTVKKYSSRKNYKLLPPLIPNQVRTSLKKQNAKVALPRQLVTLSHCLKVHNPQEMRSLPVRPARYTTNYLFVRTAPIISADKSGLTVCNTSASTPPSDTTVTTPLSATSSVSTSSVSSPAHESPFVNALSGAKFPVGTPIIFPFPQRDHPQLNMPAMSMAVTPINDLKHSTRLLTSTKIQPLFRLPYPVNTIPPNIILKTVSTTPKESCTLNKVKENPSTNISNSPISSSSNLIDGENPVNHCSSVSSHQIVSPGSPSNPAVNALKHILVPVSTPTSEIALLTSFASPVVVTAKLACTSTLTVSTRPQPHSQKIASPQVVIATSDPNSIFSTSSSNTIVSSGKVLFASPSFQLVTGKNSLQTFGAPRLRSPVIFTHLPNSVCKRPNTTMANLVRFAEPQSNCVKPLNNNTVPHSMAPTPKIQKPNCSNTGNDNTVEKNVKLNCSNSGSDNIADIPSSSFHIQNLPPPDSSRITTNTILAPSSRIHVHNLIRPFSNSNWSNQTTPKTEYSILTQKTDKLDALNYIRLPRSFPPVSSAVISVSLQSSNNINSQEKCFISPTIGLTSSSSLCSSASSINNESHLIASHNLQSNSSLIKAKSTSTVPQVLFPATSGAKQLMAHAMTTNSPGQSSVLTLLKAPPILQQPHKLSGIPESHSQLSKLLSTSTQKVELTPEPGVGIWPKSVTPVLKMAADRASYTPTFSSQGVHYKHQQDSVLPLSKTQQMTFSTNTDSSAPLSKEVAAAAMVSLSAMNTFSEVPDSLPKMFPYNCTSQPQQLPHPPNFSTCSQSAAQFLIPSSDRSKLVISAAGIEHLQSLLRKQGASQGYFIITSPRLQPKPEDVKRADKVVVSSTCVTSNDKVITSLSSNTNSVSSKDVPVTSLMRIFCSGNVNNYALRDENTNRHSQALGRKEGNFEVGSDNESDNENSSSYSRSSSAALVIETGEDDEKMEMDRPDTDSSKDGSNKNTKDENLSEPGSIDKVCSDKNTTTDQQSPKLAQDTTWETESNEDGRQSIPQSPLSLSDLVKQQQNRPGFSRHLEYSFLTSPDNKTKATARKNSISRKNSSESPRLTSSTSDDFQFPMPSCPTSSLSTTQQHSGSDIQSSFQHNMFTPHSSFSSELTFDSSVNHMEPRNSHGLDDVSNPSPKLMTNVVNIASPKSPLSLNSNQTLDQNTPLNPPMTPNTMLINLLNRVPTPFLTNPQDLLSVPTSQDNVTHEADTAGDFEMSDNKTSNGMFSGKNLDFASSSNHTQLNPSAGQGHSLLYIESSRSLSSNTESYVPAENALELIASSYIPSSSGVNVLTHEVNNSSSFTMIGSKSFCHSSFRQSSLPGETHSLNFSENFHQGPTGRDICNSFHCKSCPGPLLVTVNLEPEFPKYMETHRDGEEKTSENLLGTYGHTHVFDNSLNIEGPGQGTEDTSRLVSGKSRETDILRHLILNTSTTSLHTLQPVQNLNNQPYRNPPSSFNMPQNHHSQETQFECRVESFLEPENQHKPLPGKDINQSGSFSSQDQSFLHINHVHTQPSPSYDNSNTSFQTSAHHSYESTVSSSFDNRNTSALENPTNASYIMQSHMAGGAAFGVQDLTKSNMALSHDFMESDRLQHLSQFRPEDQSSLFYQHTGQSDMHQHHYDPSNQHQTLEYHMDSLPSSHQTHEYSSTSLSHASSSRMFSDHTENVEYMDSQYQTQYYDSGGVTSSLPLFPQQCVVGSEAPVLGNTAEHPCNIPFNNAPRGLQLEFRFPQDEDDDDDDGNSIEKQPVLPSASFSPPSVADQAANTDPGGMSMYHGSFPNLSMYDMYMRGGSADARGVVADAVQESGNFCVECNVMYKAQCKFHPCDYVYISDTPILSHARLTLPACLRLGVSAVAGHNNNTGVYAKDKIAVRTKFGPLIGSPVSCDKLSSTRSFSLWQTFQGAGIKVIDTSDENSSNWLMFLKPARVSVEQNLVAFQHGSSVYFVTRADIEPGQELLYWFAKDYSQVLGITSKSKNAQQQLCPHCPVCKQVFTDRKQVHSHVRIQHPKPCTKKCSHCSRKFSQVSHLNAHITSVHLRVKKFVCPQCDKRFSDSSNFRKHIKSHSDERLYKCPICGKDFRQKAHLKLHMNTHMLVKNEQCGFCGKSFTRAFTRRQHELQHTKQNKIPCAHCDKVFYKQQVYKQHLKIHSNERKYVCSHCNRAFRTKANLTRHGPTCKQQKCVVIPPPATLPSSQIQADFLHTNHSEVSLTSYSNDATTTNESV